MIPSPPYSQKHDRYEIYVKKILYELEIKVFSG